MPRLTRFEAPIAPQAKRVLLAPTWRGPLPTVMGGQRPFFARLCRLVDLPLPAQRQPSGPAPHGGWSRHSDPAFLDGGRLREKLAVTRAPGARFASVRFVTGRLDPITRRAARPILVVYGAETPPRSRAEMEALAALPGVRSVQLARGKLAVHEEFPDNTAAAIEAFLREQPHSSAAS
jgi:pimeloyl-ACP methyl ester carboxylesterase